MSQEPRLLSPGVIARELREPLHRVLHVLATRPHIRPLARAGIIRLYDREAVVLIQEALLAIDSRSTLPLPASTEMARVRAELSVVATKKGRQIAPDAHDKEGAQP